MCWRQGMIDEVRWRRWGLHLSGGSADLLVGQWGLGAVSAKRQIRVARVIRASAITACPPRRALGKWRLALAWLQWHELALSYAKDPTQNDEE